MRKIISLLTLAVGISLLTGCVAPKDYTAFKAHHPRSILVLPPMNESVDVNATYGYYSTVTRPLAEMGYYVYPVAIVDQFLKENGMPTAGEMHQIPLNKIRSIIGADAVLYVAIKQYGTKYQILDSVSVVEVSARLIDVDTGNKIWSGHALAQQSASNGQGLIGSLVAAAVNQVLTANSDKAHDLAPMANTQLFCTRNKGLLYGPYHPEYLTSE